jgi:hypothetical protein
MIKNTKPGFIRRWLARVWLQAREDYDYGDEKDEDIGSRSISSMDHSFSRDRGFTFTVYGADRGHVIAVQHTDTKKDERIHRLYIVTEDDDFGKQISKILTAEGLHR